MPREYVKTMQDTMLDHCPVSPYSEVRRIIQEDLGKPPEELFVSIEQTPLASASLAQAGSLALAFIRTPKPCDRPGLCF